jgi:transposase
MTAAWRNRQELIEQAVTLAGQGLARRAIARALGVSRNTVRSLLEEHRTARETAHTALPRSRHAAPRAKKIDSFTKQVAELLERYPHITAQRVYEELRSAGFSGGYTAVKKHLRSVRPRPAPVASLVTPTYGPGDMAESDWSPFTVDLGGRRQTLQVHSYVLVYTPRKCFSMHEQCDLHALMAGHIIAFRRFKGVARRCKYDSQKPVVLRWEGQQPIYNPAFLAFSAYYEFRPVAVRRGHPNDKPRTERSFWELDRSFLNGRSFRDFGDLQEQLTRWLDDVVDQRRRRQSSVTPLERFCSEEQAALVPLPRHAYDTARVVYRVASIDGFVAWQGNQYAVPYEHVTDILPVRITERELFVYAADLSCIARHELAPRGAALKVDPLQLHRPLRKKPVADPDQLAIAFSQMGEHAAAFFAELRSSEARYWMLHARHILRLRERYSTDDIDRALEHALLYRALDHNAVERIVATRAAPRTLDEYVAEEAAQRLEKALGSCLVEPRDLDEYDRLPAAAPMETPACPNETPPSTPPPSSSDCDDTSNSSV